MEIYIAKSSDTMLSVSRRFGLEPRALAEANQLSDPRRLTTGLALAIPAASESPLGAIEVGASIYPAIPDSILAEFLPALSYVFPFCRSINSDGSLSPIDDTKLKLLAANSGAMSILTIVNLGDDGGYSSRRAHKVLSSLKARHSFLEAILAALEEGGYHGVLLNIGYIYPFDRENYNSFLALAAELLHERGYYLITAVAPKERETEDALVCAAHDYTAHGKYADRVILLTYDWAYLHSAPQAVSPVNRIRAVLDYALGKIPPGKILLGISNYGYNWNLPWRYGDCARLISHASAANLAVSAAAQVKFDLASQASYFTYTDAAFQRHIVWFEDVRSIQARLNFVREYSLAGLSHWSVNRLYRPGMLLIGSQYCTEKLN